MPARIIGFNFTKVSAEKSQAFKSSKIDINTNIEFTKVEKETLELLKGGEATKISFNFSINYGDEKKPEAKIGFEGLIVLTADEKETNDIYQSWKNKQLPQQTQIPLFNIILKKSAARALQLQDELNLPSHVRIPQIQPKQVINKNQEEIQEKSNKNENN
jgi:hypothetical protein